MVLLWLIIISSPDHYLEVPAPVFITSSPSIVKYLGCVLLSNLVTHWIRLSSRPILVSKILFMPTWVHQQEPQLLSTPLTATSSWHTAVPLHLPPSSPSTVSGFCSYFTIKLSFGCGPKRPSIAYLRSSRTTSTENKLFFFLILLGCQHLGLLCLAQIMSQPRELTLGKQGGCYFSTILFSTCLLDLVLRTRNQMLNPGERKGILDFSLLNLLNELLQCLPLSHISARLLQMLQFLFPFVTNSLCSRVPQSSHNSNRFYLCS